MIDDGVQLADVRSRFLAAVPFKHAIIDGFFDDGVARELLEEFPPFEATTNDLRRLGPAYRRVNDYFASRAFLDWMGEITGIPDLLYDPENLDGGTHEQIDGQDLLTHVDVNYHPKTGFRRRLNLIVYFNEGWQARWGGSIALHSDPQNPAQDRVRAYVSGFNRAILFETNEHSWHGFDRIALPPDQRHRSRKSLSIYLYSRERSEEEIVSKREPDGAFEAHARMRIADLLARSRLPMMGYARQVGEVVGWFEDGWTSHTMTFSIRAVRSVTSCSVVGMVPEAMPPGATIDLTVDGVSIGRHPIAPGRIAVTWPLSLAADVPVSLSIVLSDCVNHNALGLNEDERDLGIFLNDIIFDHGDA